MKPKVSFFHDTRKITESQEAIIYIRIAYRRTTALIKTDVKVRADQWDKDECMVIRHYKKTRFNNELDEAFRRVDNAIDSLCDETDISNWTASEIKAAIDKEEKKANKVTNFATAFKEFMDLKQGRTRDIYAATWKRIMDFERRSTHLRFEDVSQTWLQHFDDFLSETSPSANARAVHMRNIRAVFNYALDEEMTSLYPFRKFKIKRVPTRKRSLTVDYIRELASMKLKGKDAFARDMFMLSFYLIGINMVDMYGLTSECINKSRIEYIRSKTKKMYSIKIEPEAQALIDKYKGDERLLCLADKFKSHTAATKEINEQLQMMTGNLKITRTRRKGKDVTVYERDKSKEQVSLYWGRHSWATIARNECGIGIDDIRQALGHSNRGSEITMVYIDEDRDKIDAANRKVIDYVLNREKAENGRLEARGTEKESPAK